MKIAVSVMKCLLLLIFLIAKNKASANVFRNAIFDDRSAVENPKWRNPLSSFYEDSKTEADILSVYKLLQKYYLPVPKYIDNKNCSEVIRTFFINLNQGLDSWALKMADSWGKLPDGFLFGNVHALGMYEECLKVEVAAKDDSNPFNGKYCTIYYETDEKDNNSSDTLASKWLWTSRSGPAMIYVLDPLPYNYATCMPSVCTGNDLAVSLNKTLEKANRKVLKIICTEEERDVDNFDSFDAVISAILVILILLVILGSVIDSLIQKHQLRAKNYIVESLLFLLCCFSLLRNFKKIFQFKKKAPDEIACLHGMRVITLIWIITCHQYTTAVNFATNTLNADKYQDPLIGQFITNGYPSVDTFFCISGLLIMYRLLPPVIKGEGLNYHLAFIRRILRLGPSIFIVASFSASILRFFGWGPRNSYLKDWSNVECRDNWWKDPLFIDNYVIGENNGYTVNDCLGHCWYTAVDMQLFLIVPFLLVPLGFHWRRGLLWLCFLTLGSVVVPAVIIAVNQFPPIPIVYMSLPDHFDFMTKYYLVPWCRAAPWFVGMWTGLLLVKKHRSLPKLSSAAVLIGYVIAIAIGVSVTLGLYRYNHVGEHDPIDTWVSAIYGAFSRPAWALAISWVIITCHEGRAGIVNVGLSWWGWQPLSRLTFCMYLVAPVVQLWWTTVLFVPPYYNYLGKLFEVSGVFFISFIFALMVSLLVERPFLSMTGVFATSQSIHSKPKPEDIKVVE